jgi:hypothetical protein
VPVPNEQTEPYVNPISNKFPVISSQILETKEPTIVTTPDGTRKFIIIPQSSGGTSYYILMPVQQNQISISANSICASKASTAVLVQDAKTEIQPEDGKLFPEVDSQKSKSAMMGTTKKEKDKSNLSVLSLVCSDLLDQDTVPYEQANKEISGNSPQSEDGKLSEDSTSKQSINTLASWNPEKNERKTVDSVKKEKSSKVQILTSTPVNLNNRENTIYAAPRADNEDHPPSFETPSVGSPLLFSIPANTYPVAPAQYVPIKCEPSADDICCAKRVQLSQHGVPFPQNQISMQQQYYGMSPFIAPPTCSSNAYIAQNQIPSYYQLRQKLLQQATPTLSFAFSPGVSNINTSQSQTHDYSNANASASPNGSNVSSQNYSNYSV